MARKTREEKLQLQIDNIENILEAIESPAMVHIKKLYFTSEKDIEEGKYYLHVKEYRGKNYIRLALERVDIENGDMEPAAKEIAGYGREGNITAKYTAPNDSSLEVKKVMSMAEAKKYYEKLLTSKKAELEDLYEPRQLKKAGQVEKALKNK